MQKLSESVDNNDFLSQIVSLDASKISDENVLAQINSFKMMFRKIERTPKMAMMMLKIDCGFNFDYYIEAKNKSSAECMDILRQDWNGNCFIVPKHDKYIKIDQWLDKCLKESIRGNTCVLLIPSSTSTKWFHKKVLGKAEVLFIEGRLKFPGFTKQSQFPSALAIYYSDKDKETRNINTEMEYIKSASFVDGSTTNFAVLSSMTDPTLKVQITEKNSDDIDNTNNNSKKQKLENDEKNM